MKRSVPCTHNLPTSRLDRLLSCPSFILFLAVNPERCCRHTNEHGEDGIRSAGDYVRRRSHVILDDAGKCGTVNNRSRTRGLTPASPVEIPSFREADNLMWGTTRWRCRGRGSLGGLGPCTEAVSTDQMTILVIKPIQSEAFARSNFGSPQTGNYFGERLPRLLSAPAVDLGKARGNNRYVVAVFDVSIQAYNCYFNNS